MCTRQGDISVLKNTVHNVEARYSTCRKYPCKSALRNQPAAATSQIKFQFTNIALSRSCLDKFWVNYFTTFVEEDDGWHLLCGTRYIREKIRRYTLSACQLCQRIYIRILSASHSSVTLFRSCTRSISSLRFSEIEVMRASVTTTAFYAPLYSPTEESLMYCV